jgi:uncharacterized membrane protein
MSSLSTFSSMLVLVVAIVSLVLMILTWMAANRTGHRKVRYVAAAFGVHFVKSSIVAYGLFTGSIGHEILEVVEAVFDALMIALLAIPFWARS